MWGEESGERRMVAVGGMSGVVQSVRCAVMEG